MQKQFNEVMHRRKSRYLARFLSWKLGRKVHEPRGNLDSMNPHWIHMPLVWEDNDEPITTPA